MSDTTTETAETPTEDTAPADNTQQAPTAEPTEADGTHEDRQDRDAIKYRRRLRDTEAERDTLATQVEALQRAAIDAQADRENIKPAALWASGVELADLLTETGTVDTDKVEVAITAARDSLGIPAPLRNHAPHEGGNPHPGNTTGLDGMRDVVMGRS